MAAYVKMKDFTSHYQKPADCREGISWPSKCATTAEILLWFQALWRGVSLSALSDDLDDGREINASKLCCSKKKQEEEEEMFRTHCAPRKDVALLRDSSINFHWVTTKPSIKTKQTAEVRHLIISGITVVMLFNIIKSFYFNSSLMTRFALCGCVFQQWHLQEANSWSGCSIMIHLLHQRGTTTMRLTRPTNWLGNFIVFFVFNFSTRP